MSTGRVHRQLPRRTASLRGTPSVPRARAIAAAAALALALAALAPEARAGCCCPGEPRAWKACEVLQPIGSTLSVRFPDDTTWASLAFGSIQLQDAARSLRRPRRATVAYETVDGAPTLTALGVRMDRRTRVVAVLLVAGATLLLTLILTGGRPHELALGRDNRYSASKCQMMVWFGVLVVSYGVTVALRWWAGGGQFAGAVGVPDNLLVLSGLSAISFVGAKAITQGKQDRAEARLREPVAAVVVVPRKTRAPRPAFPADLVCDDDGDVDFGNFQMVVITLLAVVVYAVRVFVCLGRVELGCATLLPDVDTTILAAFGIGQGAYLTKKAASRLGEG